jgi:hypothetical protein
MNAAVPGCERGIVTRSLFPCCIETIRQDTRRTMVGDDIVCPTCLDIATVAPDGQWRWKMNGKGKR